MAYEEAGEAFDRAQFLKPLKTNPSLYLTDPEFKKKVDEGRSMGYDDNYSTYAIEAMSKGTDPKQLMSFDDFLKQGGQKGKSGYNTIVVPLLEQIDSRNLINKNRDEASATGQKQLTQFKDERKARRATLANILKEQGDYTFNQESPLLLEDLSSRGLLHSSAVGQAFGKAKEDIANKNSFALQTQEQADLDAEQSLGGAITDRTLAYNDAALGRDFSIDDIIMANQGSMTAANKAADAANKQSQSNDTATYTTTAATIIAAII